MAPMLDFARTAPIDAAYLRHVVDRLASIGSSPLGFRATGTPEDRAVADFVAAEMRDIGPRRGRDRAGSGGRLAPARRAASRSPAAPSTGAPRWAARRRPARGGVLAPLVDVGTGERRRLDRLEVAGRIALLDWRTPTARSRDRSRARPARRARRDSQLPRRRAVLPVGSERSAHSPRTGTPAPRRS